MSTDPKNPDNGPGEKKPGDQNPTEGAGDLNNEHEELLIVERQNRKKIETENAALKAEIAKLKSTDKASGDAKAMLDQLQKENEELKNKIENREIDDIRDRKINKVLGEATKLGLNPAKSERFQKFIETDIDSISHAVSQEGKLLISGADRLAKSMKEQFPEFFTTIKSNANPGGGTGRPNIDGGEKMTLDRVTEISLKHGSSSKEFKDAWAQYKKDFPKFSRASA